MKLLNKKNILTFITATFVSIIGIVVINILMITATSFILLKLMRGKNNGKRNKKKVERN